MDTATQPDAEIESSQDNNISVKSDSAEKQPQKDRVPGNSNEIIINKDLKILWKEPLPHLDKGKIKAYRVIGNGKYASDLFALVCHKSLTPRTIAAIKYSKVINSGITKLITSVKAVWPDTNEQKLCFIYENTLGQPLWTDKGKHPALGWKPELVLENIAYPIISILMDMRDKDIVHSEIWPGNMYFNGAEAKKLQSGEKIKLGECLVAPASSQLPALYEPIERALASSIGRGSGTFSDDLYSFGVSLAVILRTTDSLQNLSDEEIIEQKIEKGSYATLIGKDRLSGAMLELLRGLLYDDPSQRWTLDDVQAWMDGRRLSPKQSSKRVKASRPIIVDGKKYTRPEVLAKDIWKCPDQAAKIVENGELEQWLERAIDDKTLKIRMDQLFAEIPKYDRSTGYHERLTVAVASSLYTEGPVRYQNLSFIPSGFGKAMVEAYVQKYDIQPFVDILKHNFIIQCIRNRKKMADSTPLISKFDSCKAFMSQATIGSGLERCLYLMDSEAPCLSPLLEKHYVQTPEEMMQAFEDICEISSPSLLFDRHIVSFLSVKDRKNIDPYMNDLSSEDAYQRILGQLRTLATIQKRSRLDLFPAITRWVASNLDPLYDRFHDSKKRKELKKQVGLVRKTGDLSKMAVLFDDPKIYQADIGKFHQAMEEYRRIEDEKTLIEEKLKNRKDYGQRTGRQIASVASMGISILIIVFTAYVVLLKG